MEYSKEHSLKVALALLIIGVLVVFINSQTAAQSASAWLKSGNPEFAIRQAAVSDADYPTTISGRGNIDCDILNLTKRDGTALSLLPPLYIESKVSGCYVNTTIGQVDGNGYVNVSGTDYGAEMIDQNNTPAFYRAFPNSDIYISNTSSAPQGGYVWLNHLRSAVTYSTNLGGKIIAKFDSSQQRQLVDKSLAPLAVMGDNFAVSDNGRWLLADAPGKAVLRIDLQTMGVLPFAPSFEFGNGIGAALRLAITSDGQHAVIASKNYQFFKIFDLSSCGAVPATISEPVTCESRDLYPFISGKIPDIGAILYMRFDTNSLINIYASYNVSTSPVTGRFALAAPGTSLAGMDYLALGDSFSSGEGAFHYEVGTDVKDINLCHLSTASYPYIIAKSLQSNSFHSVACSGAKTFNLIGGSGYSDTDTELFRDNQFNKVPNNNALGTWLPGYQKQINFVSRNSPHLITATAIGNDLGFANIVADCVKPGTCYPSYEDQLEVFKAVESKLPVLVAMYQKIKKAAPVDANIYAIGYPQVAQSNGSCGINVHLSQAELTFAGSLISRIDQVVQTAALRAGVYYTDTEQALVGHRLCEGTPDSMGMNGLTAGGDAHYIIGNESFHPTALGQSLMAQAILRSMASASSTKPLAQPNAVLPLLATLPTSLDSVPKTNRALNKKLFIDPQSITLSDRTATVALDGLAYGLPPNAAFAVYQDGTASGSAATDAQGILNATVPLPNNNLHTIDMYGTDVTGQPVDISVVITTKPVNAGDTQLCVSGVDIDKDNIDDACDPVIGTAPATPPVTPIPETPATTVPPGTTPQPTTANQPPMTQQTNSSTPTQTTVGQAPKPSVILAATTNPVPPNQTTVAEEPITFDDPIEQEQDIAEPQTSPLPAANQPTADTPALAQTGVSPQASTPKSAAQDPVQTTVTGQVLGATTTRPLPLHLQELASTTRAALYFTASSHPVRLLILLITAIIILLCLGWQYLRELRHKQLYISPVRHRMRL